jgi:tetratricopeptide (TPR) repeat protein
MPKENQTDPRQNFVPRRLPWLLALAMLLIYWITLNRWVTLANLGQVATVSGWIWQPQLYSPLMYLATWPFRWLPAAAIPLALNLFSSLCSAAALAMLARSVALLPHDHTEIERQRVRSDFAFLTGWHAWLPPVLAVTLAGLQLTFWQHATSFTGESFDLLLFAFVIWQLLEYRLDEKESRLYVVAAVYGAGLSENWALVALFPVFLTAIIWLRKSGFFNLHFLGRMILCGLAGMLFFLLLPVLVKFNGTYSLTIWEALKPNLQQDWHVLQAIQDGGIRHNLALMALTTLLPLLVLAIRWSSNFGDQSRTGVALAHYMMHIVHAVIFTVSVWVMFDPPFSPHRLSFNFPYPFYGTPSLTLYYLSALAVGYYCGYFLLVFGKKALISRRGRTPLPALPPFLLWLCPVLVVGTFTAAALAVGVMFYKNGSIIRKNNSDVLQKYAKFATQNLPANGGILLCDSENPSQDRPIRGFLMQAMLAREGREKKFLVVDTQSLNWAPYHRFLHRQNPGQWPKIVKDTDMGAVNPLGILGMLNLLSKSNSICYLNPSYGYYFERFYQEPLGLVYPMKTLPEDTLLPPALDKKQIAENESFWTQTVATELPKIQTVLAQQDAQTSKSKADNQNGFQWLLMHLHISPKPDINALVAGTFYSRGLNFWGVELQRAGDLDRAAVRFNDALKMNPDNIAAAINLEFNHALRTGTATEVKISAITPDQFGKYRNWNELLNACGPFDDTSFCFENGVLLVQGRMLKQALQPFTRVRQLAPDNLATRLWLAQLYIFSRQPDRALEALHDPLTTPSRFGLTATNATELNVLAAAVYFQKNETAEGVAILEREMARHPDDNTLHTAATQAYMMRGLYTNALEIINNRLARTPDDPQWLFGRGLAFQQMTNYSGAIADFSRILKLQTNNPDALFNRAVAYLQSDRLDLSRADYRQLQSAYTNEFKVAYGLGEIATRQHDTNEAIRNFRIYLAHAPTNSAEYKTVRERLTQLGGK